MTRVNEIEIMNQNYNKIMVINAEGSVQSKYTFEIFLMRKRWGASGVNKYVIIIFTTMNTNKYHRMYFKIYTHIYIYIWQVRILYSNVCIAHKLTSKCTANGCPPLYGLVMNHRIFSFATNFLFIIIMSNSAS